MASHLIRYESPGQSIIDCRNPLRQHVTICFAPAGMQFSDEDIEQLRPRVRFKVCYEVGFLCPDVDDIVQETLTRFFVASKDDKVRNTAAPGAFLNGICRNVILEYRRRTFRDEPMPEVIPEPQGRRLPEVDLFEMQDAIAAGMEQLSPRDRRILRAYYLEEKSKEEILKVTGMTDENFRVVLCRAKERFRNIYLEQTKHRRL
jgi:RNA polymerase sigma factor (sigma-70 family)